MPTFFGFAGFILGVIGIYFLCIGNYWVGIVSLAFSFNSLGFDFVIMEIRALKSPT